MKHDVTEPECSDRHDILTGLPDRASFGAYLSDTIAVARATGESFSVVRLDIDRFRDINNSFGHAVGDGVLKVVSRRLREAAPEYFIARIGGDEFIVATPTSRSEAELTRELSSLQAAVAREIRVSGHAIRTSITAGVATFSIRNSNEIEIVATADIALRKAKRNGVQSICFFDENTMRPMKDRARVQKDLRTAIDRCELQLHYQPLITSRGSITGFEALIRWRHPTRGQIPPDAFIPIAEQCGLIIPLSRWVLRQACREAASWKNPLTIAVNISGVQIQQEDLSALVKSVLSETGLAPERLELEITEGVLISDSGRAQATLARLRDLGVQIVLDDFGTGYSSLLYLRDFPISKIKIDRSFVAKIGVQKTSKTIIHAVIGLGHAMDLTVTAEGVETEEQLQYLLHEGCDRIQGYLLGRPAPIEAFAPFTGNADHPAAFYGGAPAQKRSDAATWSFHHAV